MQNNYLLNTHFIFANGIMQGNANIVSGITLSLLDFYNLESFEDAEQAHKARQVSQQNCELLLDIALATPNAQDAAAPEEEAEDFSEEEAMSNARTANFKKDVSEQNEQNEIGDSTRIIRLIPKQSHSTKVVKIERDAISKDATIEADGLYTFDTDISIGVTVADCVGIVFYEAKSGFMAALHSGWKGTLGIEGYATIPAPSKRTSIVGNCLAQCTQYEGIAVEDIKAWISPSAKACCYEVGEELAQGFARYEGVVSIAGKAPSNNTIINEPKNTALIKTVGHISRNTYYVDMSRYIAQELYELGLDPAKVELSPYCTICDTRFHSHRRMGTKAGRAQVFIMKRTV